MRRLALFRNAYFFFCRLLPREHRLNDRRARVSAFYGTRLLGERDAKLTTGTYDAPANPLCGESNDM